MNRRIKARCKREVLRGSTRRVRDKARGKRASVERIYLGTKRVREQREVQTGSVEEIDKASQRRKQGAHGLLLRGSTR